jgi:PDZ domain-containing protein
VRFDAGQGPWTPTIKTRVATRGKGRLPFAAVRPDYELIPVNGTRLHTPGHARQIPVATINAVSYRAELRPTAVEVLSHLMDPQAAVIARSRLTGGRPIEEVEAAGVHDSAWSRDSAIGAAALILGHDVQETGGGALVQAVRDDVVDLRREDVVTAVDGTSVATASQLRSLLAGLDTARLTLRRAADTSRPAAELSLRVSRCADGTWGIRVVTAARVLSHGLAASFSMPEDLLGPSLGLACALSVVDAFTGGRLAAGGSIVATGTVDLAGRVGAIGAIEYKARAVAAHPQVRRFLVPAESDVDVELARRELAGKAEVIAVATLAEAVQALGSGLRTTKAMRRSLDRHLG